MEMTLDGEVRTQNSPYLMMSLLMNNVMPLRGLGFYPQSLG